MTLNINAAFDDLPVSPRGSVVAAEFYDSYLKCEELVGCLPKKLLGQESAFAFYRMLQDVHSTRAANTEFFRRKSDASEALITLWLSRVRLTAQMFIAMNDVPEYRALTPDHLLSLAKLSVRPENLSEVAATLLGLGIVLIYERSLPGMKLDGAVFSLAGNRPVIALSLRYPRLDHYWFTLMHELAHVVLHLDRLDVPILDDLDESKDDITERQADRLAANSLISRSDWRSSICMYDQSESAVVKFAAQVGVHPSIVAGRMRRELNRHDIFSKIVNEVDVRKVLLGDE